MGQLVDGVWRMSGMTPNPPVDASSALFRPSVTGLPPMVLPARVAKVALRPRKIVITSMFPSPARGRTAR